MVLGLLKAENTRSREGGEGLGPQVGTKTRVPPRPWDDRERTLQNGFPGQRVPSMTTLPRTLPITQALTPPLTFWLSGKRLRNPGEPALLAPKIRMKGFSEHFTLGRCPCSAPDQLGKHLCPGPLTQLWTCSVSEL